MRPHRSISLFFVLALVASTVSFLDTRPARAATFTDIGSSAFRVQIEWLAASGITYGCGDGRFCPDGLVTRAQMATLLARALDLKPSTSDYFTDDDGGAHEPNINRIAAAGITVGCSPTQYCPNGLVTRAQMATLLARAARLPAATGDFFLDDERSAHEAAINRVAAAGISGGCGYHRFCPDGQVTRGQLAAFLYRLDHPTPTPPRLPDVGPLPICRYDDVLTARRTTGHWDSSLLDTIYRLPSSYVPGDLVDTSKAGVNAGYSIRRLALADFADLVAAARAAGKPIRVVSAYRSYSTQQATFASWVARDGLDAALRGSARPGHSEHQLGTTVDVTHAGGAGPWDYRDWATHPTGAWMRDNAWRFGFVMSYPKNAIDVTCYQYEPWHYRYVGREVAREVRLSGLTLREWIWRIYGE